MITATPAPRVITDCEIGAGELQVAINNRRGESTPQWIRDLANVKLPRPPMVVPGTTA